MDDNPKESLYPYAMIGVGVASYLAFMMMHRRGFGRVFFPTLLEGVMTCGLVVIGLFAASVLLKTYKWIEFGEPGISALKFAGIGVLLCGLMLWLPVWVVVVLAGGVFGLVYWLFELTEKETLPWLGVFPGVFIVTWVTAHFLLAYANA